MSSEIPNLRIETRHALCYVHSLPFVDHPEAKVLDFAHRGLQILLSMEQTKVLCGGDMSNVVNMLTFSPICCRLNKNDLMALYLNLRVGLSGRRRCEVCKDMGPCCDVPMSGLVCVYCLVHARFREVHIPAHKLAQYKKMKGIVH